MLPTRYTQASCFKCHQNTSDLAGAENKLGLTNYRSGCNGSTYQQTESKDKSGPDLRKLNKIAPRMDYGSKSSSF